jgi:hypothetical protein
LDNGRIVIVTVGEKPGMLPLEFLDFTVLAAQLTAT